MNAREDPNIDDLDWRPLSAELMVLVCRQCRKRRDGPKHLKAKDLASTFRVATKSRRLKARTLLTSCQGLCPKDATSWSRSLEGSRWARHVPLDRSMWSKASLLRPRSPARTVPLATFSRISAASIRWTVRGSTSMKGSVTPAAD